MGACKVDVAIIGAGFTGLWAAYYLKTLAPGLDVAIVEAEGVGHGASGRNGGWVIGGIAGLARHIGGFSYERRRACCDLLAANVDAIGGTLAAENIDADFHKGGSIAAAALYPEQVAIQKHYLEALHTLGYREDACYWLDADALAARARLHNGYGGVFHRDCATVHPGKLVAGLAAAVEKQGVTIYEHSRALAIESEVVRTAGGRIDAPTVVAATEGYSHGLSRLQRRIIPVQSLIIATEPLSQALWDEIGLADRPSFADASRLINYGQRTADDRIVFGARGDYRYGGKPKQSQGISAADIQMRSHLLADLFPILKDVPVAYGWGGSVGLSRNFYPHAIVDRGRGLATAGGYAGEGVAASYLFARTLAELILGIKSERTAMPWAWPDARFEQVLKRWEPEPMRWLTARTISFCYAREDALMRRQKPAPRRKAVLGRLNERFATIVE
jgi:glycine/D-amino acid oxidase-like deaminating enzyme